MEQVGSGERRRNIEQGTRNVEHEIENNIEQGTRIKDQGSRIKE
ncbi:MAG: hypothetical protein ABFD02_04680 [Bacteroidales bacterium]